MPTESEMSTHFMPEMANIPEHASPIIPKSSEPSENSKFEAAYSLAETDRFIENINKNIAKICGDKDFLSSWEARESVQAIIDLLVRSTNISSTLEELKVRGLDYLAKRIPDTDLKNLFFRQIDPRCLGRLPIN